MQKKVSILIVEDNLMAAKIANMLFERCGLSVSCATTGNEALTKLKENQFDLMLLDIGLPDIDGFEVLQVMNENILHKPKVFVLTAHLDQDAVTRLSALGIAGFYEKPITMSMCQTILAQVDKK